MGKYVSILSMLMQVFNCGDSYEKCLYCRDYHEFLDDLEEDPGMRQHVNIYKDSTKQIPVDSDDVYDETEPHITLEEMLDDLVIDDVEMEDC